MDVLTVEGVRIEAIAACVPENVVVNDERSARATGILTRRIASPGTTVADLTVRAAGGAMADAGVSPEEFGAIILVSFTQRHRMPATAAEAQARLGLPKGVVAFDVSLACSGWGHGLYLAALLVRQTGKRVLLLDGDVQSAFVKTDDKDVSPLLGDAGTATVVGPGTDVWRFAFVSDGEKRAALTLEEGGSIRMDGFGVFRFVATDVVTYIKEFLSDLRHSNGQAFEHPNLTFVPHQPNVYMVRQLAKSAGFPADRVAVSCDELGNLSSASVPVTIARKDVRGRVLFAGFGGGLSVSLGVIEISGDCRFRFGRISDF